MVLVRSFWGVVLASFFVSNLLTAAPDPKPKVKSTPPKKFAGVAFKDNPTLLRVEVNQDFRLDLRSLLSNQGTGNLVWDARDRPTWLQLNGNFFDGKPTAAQVGTTEFRLTVGDGDSGAVTLVRLSVVQVPKWTKDPLDLGKHPEDVAVNIDLRTFVDYKGRDALVFSATGLKPWMSISTDGKITGTPRRADVGSFAGIKLTVKNQAGDTHTVDAFGEVTKVNKGPKWTANPLNLDNAPEGQLYSIDLKQFVVKNDAPTLLFEIVGARPPWLSLSAQGILSGTPKRTDVGPVQITARVRATIQGTQMGDNTIIRFQVEKVNHPPVWAADPLSLPNARTKKAYLQNLKNSVTDPDGDALTFKLISGPGWAKVATDGTFSGTPASTDAGNSSWVVEVTDGEFSPRTTVKITVEKTNEPPAWKADPTNLGTVDEDSNVSISLLSHVVDPDGDPLSFVGVLLPSWATVSSQGVLSGKPGKDHIGLNKMRIIVSDNIAGSDEAEIQITVRHVNHKPSWTLNPIHLNATEDVLFSADISKFAIDPDGDRLTFKVLSGAPWATLSTAGTFTGTPKRNEVGDHRYLVQVDDGNGGTADVEVFIHVEKVNHAPKWVSDPVNLPETEEGVLYTHNLSQYASDPDGDTLTFSAASLPSWLTLNTTTGVLTGTPSKTQVGTVSIRVGARDPGNLSATTTIVFVVKKANTPPRWKEIPIAMPTATVGVDYNFALAPLVVDDDGDTLTFKLIRGPAWMKVAADGRVSGIPSLSQVGNYVAQFEVTDGKANVPNDAFGKVVKTSGPPVVTTPLEFTVKVATIVQKDLNAFVSDPDGDTLSYTPVGFPAWVSLSPAGILEMRPQATQLGVHNHTVQIFDGTTTIQAPLKITVIPDVKPPFWLEDPIVIPGFINVQLNTSIANKARDPQALPLTFSKVSGDAWLTISQQGLVTGAPPNANQHRFRVSVQNSAGLSAETELIVAVDGGTINRPPLWKQDPLNLGKLSVGTQQINIAQYALDPDGDPLVFKIVSGPSWMQMTQAGQLTASPTQANLGPFVAVFTVTDSKSAPVPVDVAGEVAKNPGKPPVWLEDPILLQAVVGQSMNVSIAAKAKDFDGLPLTFEKTAGKQWLSLSPQGLVTGIPTLADLNQNTFSVKVTSANGSATATMIVMVRKPDDPPIEDKLIIDSQNLNAKAELNWVVDNTWLSRTMMGSLRKNIGVFYDELKRAQVTHFNIVHSANVSKWNGLPVKRGTFIFGSADTNPVDAFVQRVNDAFQLSYCPSPLYELFLFHQLLPSRPELYRAANYYQPFVPMDVAIVTPRLDYWKSVANGKPQESWTPNQFADSFIQFHKQEKKPYRVHAFLAECEEEERCDEDFGAPPGPRSAHGDVATATGGSTWQVFSDNDFANALRDYAQLVIFRARVNGNREVKLSKRPTDPSSIMVKLNGTPLQSNQWEYDSGRNVVIIRWENIDQSQLRPGDVLSIEYRGSRGGVDKSQPLGKPGLK